MAARLGKFGTGVAHDGRIKQQQQQQQFWGQVWICLVLHLPATLQCFGRVGVGRLVCPCTLSVAALVVEFSEFSEVRPVSPTR